MKSITVQELKNWIDNQVEFQLIDVREPHENEICTLNGLLIPMNDVPGRFGEFSTEQKVVVHCRSGMRSGNVIQYLEQTQGFENLYNLEGGILAWAREIDPSMPSY